jgi:hypothetical protein
MHIVLDGAAYRQAKPDDVDSATTPTAPPVPRHSNPNVGRGTPARDVPDPATTAPRSPPEHPPPPLTADAGHPGTTSPHRRRAATARQRREPVRRPIPEGRPTTPPPRVPFDPDPPVLPVAAGSPMLGSLVNGPIEALPLYAVLTAIHLELSGNAVNACPPVCYQIVGALRHFGFAAEMMAAYVDVEKDGRRYGGIGVNGKATVYPDGTTNGHMIVWADSFGRLVDATVAQHPELNRAVHQGSLNQSAPLVLPVGERDVLLEGRDRRDPCPYELAYLAIPQYTSVFDGSIAQYREPLDYGTPSMAYRNAVTSETRRLLAAAGDASQAAGALSAAEQLVFTVGEAPELHSSRTFPRRTFGGEPPATTFSTRSGETW